MMTGRHSIAISVVIAIILASCGGGGANETSTDQGNAGGDQQNETSAAELVVCEQPPPTEITLGTPVAGDVPGFDQCFTVEVPDGASTLTVELTGLTAPLNLRVGYATVDTVQFHIGDFWQSSEDGTADELIVIESPQAGIYYVNVAVATVRDMSPFTLTVTAS